MMRVRWSVDDVGKMAPDAGSVAAGRKLADARQWKLLGASDTHLWGELQGSGAKPYQTCIERAEPAFHCSCPSRKFPCKHGLALAYIEAQTPAALSVTAAPEWVDAWVRKRAERDERKQTRSEAAAQPPDAETAQRRAKEQERRAQARQEKVRGGISFVSQWLRDAVRQGLATQAEQAYRHWDELAARTVDAQIPGLARHFRQLPALRHAQAHWQTPFLDGIARLHLLCCAYERTEQLAPEWRGDIDAALGLTQDKEALLAGSALTDRWCVMGVSAGEDEGLRYQRTWLSGQQSARSALLLDFAARGQVLPAYGAPGTCFDGELVFYPSAWPQRALLRQGGAAQPGSTLPGGLARLEEVQELYVSALEKLPWVEHIVCKLRAITPVFYEERCLLVDPGAAALPLSSECDAVWELIAFSGGRPVDLFCQFDGETLLPLSVADASGVHALPAGGTRPKDARSAAFYPPWRQAMTTALLGAERQQLALTASGAAGAALARFYPQAALPADSEARSTALLDALSLLSLYRKAAQPTQDAVALPPPCEADEAAPAAAAAAAHLREVLEAGDADLLAEWLDGAAAAGRLCPPMLLPRVLDAAARERLADAALAPVVGRRGRWLAQWHEAWRGLLASGTPDPQAAAQRDWEEGSTEQRRLALQQLRSLEPEAARASLAEVFNQEPAAVRAALLSALGTALSERDETFLESVLGDKSQEVRQGAAELLSLLPDAAFNARVRERAGAWLSFKPSSGLLGRLAGSKGALTLALPESWDAAWLRDGLTEKPPRGKGAKAWWLEQTLALVAPQHWAQQWGLDAAGCLALADGHEWREALLAGWLQATLTQRDADWATALLVLAPGAVDAELRTQLWQVLAPQTRERLFIERMDAAKPEALLDLLAVLPSWGGRWNETLSRAVLQAWRRVLSALQAHSDHRAYAQLRELATRLAPSELARFEQLFARELEGEDSWHKILNETRERLRLRHAMQTTLRSSTDSL